MSDETNTEEAWDDSFGGGFFEDAGVDITDVSDDPFNFGNGYYIVSVNEWRMPKVSESGKFGSYILFEIIADRFSKMRPFGRWVQLPTPKAIQAETGIPFSPKENPDDMAVASNFKRFLWALGFKVDEMSKANPRTCQSRQFLAKLWASENQGRWQINFGFAGIKPMPEPGTEEYNSVMALAAGGSADGANEFKQKPSGSVSVEEALRQQMAGLEAES